MPNPSPKQVFDDPSRFWAFLIQDSDSKFESQHFDRKQVGQAEADAATLSKQVKGILLEVTQTISAFANRNVEGGLLVLGIATDGSVKGTDHLNETQINSITDFGSLLHHQTAEAKFVDCTDADGNAKRICLLLAPYTSNGICETPERNPKAWIRSGPQNLPMPQEMRDRIKVTKGIVDFECTFCCPYCEDDVDQDVLAEFRKVFHPESANAFATERLLYEAGAIILRDADYGFTYAGLLFFAANPQRLLPQAYIRLLRFGVPSAQFQARGLPTYQGPDFKGPITKQIRAARTFFRESAFFERYQKRKSNGGFVDEPEYPPIAVDEAIVNAVAHRDYRTGLPIECESYSDAFIVKNPGRMLQRTIDLGGSGLLPGSRRSSRPMLTCRSNCQEARSECRHLIRCGPCPRSMICRNMISSRRSGGVGRQVRQGYIGQYFRM